MECWKRLFWDFESLTSLWLSLFRIHSAIAVHVLTFPQFCYTLKLNGLNLVEFLSKVVLWICIIDFNDKNSPLFFRNEGFWYIDMLTHVITIIFRFYLNNIKLSVQLDSSKYWVNPTWLDIRLSILFGFGTTYLTERLLLFAVLFPWVFQLREVPPSIASAIAEGHIDPITMEAFDYFPATKFHADTIKTNASDHLPQPKVQMVLKQQSCFTIFAAQKSEHEKITGKLNKL